MGFMQTRLRALIPALVLSFLHALATAQVSLNVVGYANIPFYPGENLIANQLSNGDNTLNTVLTGAAPGSTFTMWDPVANSFLPLSLFDGSAWSINYTFDLGRGGLLNSPLMATNTFVGNVINYTNLLGNQLGPGLRWEPNYAPGLYLLSNPDPFTATSSNAFYVATGRGPNDGEWMRTLDPITQTYTTTAYHTGSGWDNGDPVLNLGQAAWFDLGPVAVPEPSAVALLTFGTFWVLVSRRKSRRSRA
jgi:hypothetical protein